MKTIIKKNLMNLAIFPCCQGTKIPATLHGFNDAVIGQDAMSLFDAGFNIGLACKKSNIIVFDLDYHNENSTAEEDLQKLQEELGSELPRTLTQSTASGKGKHLIFSNKGIINPIGKIGKDIDVKHNGYIMFTPSVYNGKQYQIIDGIDDNGCFIISELPQKWIDFLNKKQNKVPSVSKKNDFTSQNKRQLLHLDNDQINKILTSCDFLIHCTNNAETLSEPEWFSMVTILAQIENSDSIIHEISKPYPKYSYEETQKKIENARKFGFPHSCRFLAEQYPMICGNCNRQVGGN